MEPVYCPNGHPNRPGTRICAVCRALLAPSSPPPPKPIAPSRPAPVSPPANILTSAVAETPSAEPVTIPPKRSRLWIGLLLFLLLAAMAVVALWASLFPITRSVEEPPTAVGATISIAAGGPTSLPPAAGGFEAIDTVSPTPSETPSIDEGSPTLVATITPLALPIMGVVITPTFAFGPDANFIQNGDFSDDWANGWTREATGDLGIIEVHPPEGELDAPALHLENLGTGRLGVAQRIVLTFPVEGLIFRALIDLTGSSSGAAEGRSALVLRYEDANGDPLGASVWLDGSAEITHLWGEGPLPESGPTVIARFVNDGWQTLELDLGREFAEGLPGIDPIAVRQITISLALMSDENCAPTDCETTLAAADLSLTAEP